MGDLTSSSSDDAMFPSANNTDTDMAASKTQQTLSSPPSSQQQQTTHIDEAVEHMEDTDGSKGGFGKSAEDRFVPGASWNNKKAKDEYSRAWTIVEDRDFSLRKSRMSYVWEKIMLMMLRESGPFGDPFDETLPENRTRKT